MCDLFKDYTNRPINTTDFVPTISIGLFEKLVGDETVQVYVKIENKNTPFHIFRGWYKKDNLIDFFRLEIENGADVITKTEDAKTSLQSLILTYKNGNLEDIIHLFTRKGAINESLL